MVLFRKGKEKGRHTREGLIVEFVCRLQDIPENSELILASDGYPVLLTTLTQSEDALAQALEDAPLCFRLYPSTKGKSPENVSFDDRTCLRIRT